MKYILPLLVLLTACRPSEPQPRPRGYARIDLPTKHEYRLFDRSDFPYAFAYPTYGEIVRDSSRLKVFPDNPYWLNVDFPTLGASLYISYNTIHSQKDFEALLNDSHEMSYKHSKRADFVKDRGYINEYGVTGVGYEWGGASASAYQFTATDSTRNYLRGALYFNVTPNADSLRPAVEFLQKDVEHLMKTIRFR